VHTIRCLAVRAQRARKRDTLRWQDAWNSLCRLRSLPFREANSRFCISLRCARTDGPTLENALARSLSWPAGPHFWMRAFHSALCLPADASELLCVVCESGPAENLLASVPVQPALSRRTFIFIYMVARSWRGEVVFVTKDVRWWPKAEPLPCRKKVVLLLLRDVRLTCILLLSFSNTFDAWLSSHSPFCHLWGVEEQASNAFDWKKNRDLCQS
jgi:hypothetical protein